MSGRHDARLSTYQISLHRRLRSLCSSLSRVSACGARYLRSSADASVDEDSRYDSTGIDGTRVNSEEVKC